MKEFWEEHRAQDVFGRDQIQLKTAKQDPKSRPYPELISSGD
jgi:hypothetical protein